MTRYEKSPFPRNRRPKKRPLGGKQFAFPLVDLSVKVPLAAPEIDRIAAHRRKVGLPLSRIVRLLLLAWIEGKVSVTV